MTAAFTVLIPARLKSTRLPRKPLADIAGKPMVVRVAERSKRCNAAGVVVAADDPEIICVCRSFGIDAILTSADHQSGSDRLAQACAILGLDSQAIVVNVQGDEPLIDPELISAVAQALATSQHASMATAAHPISSVEEFVNPNTVKVILDAHGYALTFSRAPLPWWRDGFTAGISALPVDPAPLRHIGIYAYRVDFLRQFSQLESAPLERCEQLEQLRAIWHGSRIAVHLTKSAPAAGVDTQEDLERVRSLWQGQ